MRLVENRGETFVVSRGFIRAGAYRIEPENIAEAMLAEYRLRETESWFSAGGRRCEYAPSGTSWSRWACSCPRIRS
jgi:hypothetical protein